jgi:hypothetical protein
MGDFGFLRNLRETRRAQARLQTDTAMSRSEFRFSTSIARCARASWCRCEACRPVPRARSGRSARHRIEIAQQGQVSPGEHPADGALGQTQRCGDARLGQPLVAQLHDSQSLGRFNGARRSVWSRRCIAQARFAVHQVAAQPLACCRSADAVRGRCLRHAQTALGDALNHLDSTDVRESGILMAVHSAEFRLRRRQGRRLQSALTST